MNHSYPVYTKETECQDCYKCVRRCPVKAIRVRDGHATVIPELCVACGRCVEVCPAKAKRVRDDMGRARLLVQGGDKVYVSLAPSWVSEFKNVTAPQMIHALRQLGFAGVSETALGAQLVSAAVGKSLDHMKKGVIISSACPTAVDYICKYIPPFARTITQVVSPVMAHCRLLREKFGADIKVVFIGPCIAKKNESDRHPEVLNLAMTYPELCRWFEEAGINPETQVPEATDVYVPDRAEEGAIYPIEGGMIETVKACTANDKVSYATVTGLDNLARALDGLWPENVNAPVFLEVLACPGGCVHGPCTRHDSPGLLERLRVLNSVKMPERTPERAIAADISEHFQEEPVKEEPISLRDLKAALRRIGKFTPEDELNCGGCGYETCKNFARALITGTAEPSMCVSYLKKQAQKKANALLRCIPSGVVIADKNLNIIECNRKFAATFGEDSLAAFEACPGLAGADLRRIVPFGNLFEASLKSGNDLQRDAFKVNRRLYNLTIFNIEPHEVVGAVIFDVTQTEMRREQIAERARKVIEKNLTTVQEIACRLGENMADTELLLRSIADDYADDNMLDDKTVEDRGAGNSKTSTGEGHHE
ncbi:MAG: [Fe-Fe] hydrogenase large subunit C-terminal domain-containing protein [Victivallales bacterium]|nr:[Fe-Fe] hydrogenase large subunit C-terminal domain-containing protein [Victivallales bacterium]